MANRALPPNYLKNAFERIDLKLLCNWILTGGETAPTDLNYNDRLVEDSKPIRELLENTFIDSKERGTANDYFYNAIGTYADVYTEIGTQIGARLMLELLNNKEIDK